MPARSSASQHVSRKTRCCGSISTASLGLTPKNAASKSVTSGTNPPIASLLAAPEEASQ